METEAIASDSHKNERNMSHNEFLSNGKRNVYQGYQYQKRTIMSSPGSDYIQPSPSPKFTPQKYDFKSPKLSGSPGNPIDVSNYNERVVYKKEEEFLPKNPVYPFYSPGQTGVNFPDGDSYVIHDSQNVEYVKSQTPNGVKLVRQQSFTKYSPSNNQKHFTPLQSDQRNFQKHNGSMSAGSQYSMGRIDERSRKRSDSNNSRRYRDRYDNLSDVNSDLTSDSDSDSDMKETESKIERLRRKRREEKREIKEQRQMLRLLMTDMLERKEKEKELSNNEKTKTNQTPLYQGYEMPKIDQPEPQPKSRIPNYEEMSEINKEKIKDKFRGNYNMLVVKYPNWSIQIPDFNIIPLRIIHEQYEKLVKDICIYQTAMKWKVYLIIIIAGIEYYVGHRNNYAFAKGLLKSQIKNIHKYNIYLIEFATQFYNSDSEEEYPLWIRFFGTFASALASFSSINGCVKMFGEKADLPDFIFEQADKFVSPPEGTARLHSDGISDVPEPPETGSFQDPNYLINGIGSMFSLFTGKKQEESRPQTAQPVPEERPKKVSDYDDVEL